MSWKSGAASLLALAAAGWAAPAAAQTAVKFRITGVEIQVPMPAGYCLPKGKEADAAQLIAAADDQNVTHQTLLACATAATFQEYLLIKTPTNLLNVTVQRPELLQAMGDAFNSPAFAAAMASGEITKGVEKSTSKALGTEVDFSGDLKPRGKDDVCAYLGGIIQVKAANQTARVAAATCITAVGGRAVSINWYGPDKGSAGVADLMLRTKRMAQSMTGKPVQ